MAKRTGWTARLGYGGLHGARRALAALPSSESEKDHDDLKKSAWLRSSERAEIAKQERTIYSALDAPKKAFWQAYVLRIAGAHYLVDSSRAWGQRLRLLGFVASAAVPALAVFQGSSARIAVAAVGALAVALNGAALIFRVDPRLTINRRFEAEMVDTGWQLVLRVADAKAASSTVSPDGFQAFKAEVDRLREGLTRDYINAVDTPPGGANT